MILMTPSLAQSAQNCSRAKGFVRMSAICSSVQTCSMSILSFPNALSYEVKYDVYVLASLMKNEILTEGDCRLTVHLEKKWCVLLILQLDEQLRQPSPLTARRSPYNILSFTR
jgi:hypothetical protein